MECQILFGLVPRNVTVANQFQVTIWNTQTNKISASYQKETTTQTNEIPASSQKFLYKTHKKTNFKNNDMKQFNTLQNFK